MIAGKSASIRNRFAASLTANIFRSGISFTTGLLLARWLGPESYGQMAFLLASFIAYKQLLDMASSSAFFTFLAKQQRSSNFIKFYWRWIGIQFLFSLLIIGFLLPDSIIDSVWKGGTRALVVLAMVATFMQHNVWSIAFTMAEAQRETIRVQLLNTLVAVIHLSVIVALWLGGKLLIPLIFIALILEWSIAAWIATKLSKYPDNQASELEVEHDTVVSVFKEFWQYCKPFIPYAWLSFAHDFADRWMLQHWGGSNEQAYYAVAQQFSAVALLATISILKIFWKEIAEAKHQQDEEKVKMLYLKVSRGLYFVGALIAGGLLPWTSEIIELLLGAAYSGGTFTLMLMFLYPVFQSMGQIGGTMLYATEHTRIQVVLGLVFMSTGILVSYFMLAPVDMFIPGLGLASQGLAIKIVILAIIQVNIMAWLIARLFGWKFDWIYQVVGLSSAILAGWIAKLLISSIISTHVIVLMIGSGVFYLMLMGIVVYILPWISGLEHDEMNEYLYKAARIISFKRKN